MAVADDAVEPFIRRYISVRSPPLNHAADVEYSPLSAPVMKHFANRISCQLMDKHRGRMTKTCIKSAVQSEKNIDV